MLKSLAERVVVRRRRILLLGGMITMLAVVVGAPALNTLSNGGFRDAHTQSAQAAALLDAKFGGAGDYNYMLLVRSPGGVDAPAAAAEANVLARRLAAYPGISYVTSYWQARLPALRSRDGQEALILAHLRGNEDQAMRSAKALEPTVTGRQGPVTVLAGGESAVNYQGADQVKKDLIKAESIAVPVTLAILILVFGGLIPALLPLAMAMFSITGALALLRLLGMVTAVSAFSINLVTALGLGLSIDYSLFVVNRFREELGTGSDVPSAVARTVATAGRTVVFSAVTVLISLAALLVFPLYFLRSFAYAGIAVVALATLGSVILLPALLAVLGRRAASRGGRRRARPETAGFWHRLAVLVMRRPVFIGTAAVALLLLLASPALRLSFSMPDDRVLPPGLSAAQVGQAVRDDFASSQTSTLAVVLTARPGSQDAISGYAERLSRLPGVTQVTTATGGYAHGLGTPGSVPQPAFAAPSSVWFSVATNTAPYSGSAQRLLDQVRSMPPPAGRVLVGGQTAVFSDTLHSVYGALPWALLIVALVTACLLFLFTGSVLVPVKAVLLNALTLAATFGVLVYVFQQGHLTWLTGHITVTGQLDIATPILMVCVLFGLSMDYEVFLLSRIKEEYDRTGDNPRAVALGLERTGRIVTAAAFLLAIVFASMLTSGFTHIKTLALGTALAVLLDATIVRGLLVPAIMRVAGKANWWAPAPLRWLHRRFGLSHAGQAATTAPRETPRERSALWQR
jgi:RND superfamily putative drug exporter